MKGRVFGYRQVDPCPACGTARVLVDMDDDAYVVPGRLVTHPPCEEPVIPLPALRKVYDEKLGYRVVPAEVREKHFAAFELVKNCPCGAERQRVPEQLYPGRYSEETFFAVCPRRGRVTQEVQSLEGCPQCREVHSHVGLGQ